MKLTKPIITVLMLFTFVLLHSQALKTNSAYVYDANGNRISASVIYLTSTLKSDTMKLEQVLTPGEILKTDTSNLPKNGWEQGKSDPLTGITLNIFPNPTHGLIVIGISGNSNEMLKASGNFIRVWDVQGRLIKSYENPGSYNTINLSQKPGGTYLVKINIGGQVKDYKVIKE